MSKKGQTMSINVIIVAALALIVLVVLVVIFTGRTGSFVSGVEKSGDAQLVELKIGYGQCRPTASAEANFQTGYNSATSTEAKESIVANFKDEISRCKSNSVDKSNCESAGCKWG